MKKEYVLLLIILCSINLIYGQTFTEIDAGLQGLELSTASWGDYDSDGDLDFILSGDAGNLVTKLYNNQDSNFTEINTSISGVILGSTVWGDYDNDGDLDICVSGAADTVDICRIYRNDEGVFTDINAGLTGIWCSSAAWGDYDNDGDLDLITMGYFWNGEMNYITKIYRNNSGSFTSINTDMIGLADGSVSWGDYDNDSDLDVLINGEYIENATSYYETRIYRNDTGTFTDINAGIIGLSHGSVSWGDYDNDGDLDILLAGYYYDGGSHNISKIYRNDSGMFTDILAGLTGIGYGSSAWGDCNNDGFLDAIISGVTSTETITKIYRNNKDHTFSEINSGLSGVSYGVAICGDYDNDNDLDILVSGTGISKIFRNETEAPNNCPSPPVNLLSNTDGLQVTLSWNKATDIETPQDGLSYNIYIGTQSGLSNICDPMSETSNGYRKIVSMGNSGLNNYKVLNLPAGQYFWSVQAVDNCFGGSQFSEEQSFVLNAGIFTDLNAGLAGVSYGSTDWGDYDYDGDLDILITGFIGNANFISKIYRNDNNNFVDVYANLINVVSGSSTWFDYDNDGDLDVLLCGYTGTSYITKIYRNNFGLFSDINANLPGVVSGTASYGDYDNDGDLDILIVGHSSYGDISRIYRNDNLTFNDINANMIGLSSGSSDWADYDNDGDLDILLSGYTEEECVTKIYQNNSGVFNDLNANILGVSSGTALWGDYDNDGDFDIILTGKNNENNKITRIYDNNDGIFTESSLDFLDFAYAAVAMGDYDNDGDSDILLSGAVYGGLATRFLKNENSSFVEMDLGLPGVWNCSTDFGDYDNDSDLDVLITGENSEGVRISRIYRNEIEVSNTKPDPPSNLTFIFSDSTATLSWNKADDNETPQDGLSYNLYFGFETQIGDIQSSMSNNVTGNRKVVKIGNCQKKNNWKISNLPLGKYYWSVQSIDNSYESSEFAEEVSSQTYIEAPLASEATSITGTGFTANWNPVAGISNYILDVSYDPDFEEFVQGFQELKVDGSIFKTIEGLSVSTDYYYRVRSFINDAISESSNVISVKTLYLPFTDIEAGLPGVDLSSSAWGDYDNDGDLDILITGYNGSLRFTRIYKNNNGSFIDIGAGLTPMNHSSADWGDYDNDGDLDLLITGFNVYESYTTIYEYYSIVYRNDNGSFIDINADLEEIIDGDAVWGDYDNDGDLDICLCGSTAGGYETIIYRNNSGVFTDINANLVDVDYSSADWGDYDNDGDLDLIISGVNSSSDCSFIYRNESGVFVDVNSMLPETSGGTVQWGDYDNDGDLDLLMTSVVGVGNKTRVYRNDLGVFVDTNSDLISVYASSGAWGDYDNDGDLDLIISGKISTSAGSITKIYRNDSGSFLGIEIELEKVSSGSINWGDFDNDKDLDILLTGLTNTTRVSKLYRNNTKVINNPPILPTNLSSEVIGTDVVLSWNKSADIETPQQGLSYNIYISSVSHKGNIKNSMSDVASGYKKTVSLGNTNHKNSWIIKNLAGGTYYWSVQAVDHSYVGSEFSTESSFEYSVMDPNPPSIPVALNADQITGNSFNANWNSSLFAVGYYIDVARDENFTDFVSGYSNLDAGNTNSCAIYGLENDSIFYYRVRSYNSGYTSANSNIITVTIPLPTTPIAKSATGVTDISFIANWDLSEFATGYRIDVAYDSLFTSFVSGFQNLDALNIDSLIVTGLDTNIDYYYRIKAYNIVGGSDYSNIVKVKTLYVPFSLIGTSIPGSFYGSISPTDFDNDGDMDVLVSGLYGGTRIYRNEGNGIFADIYAGLKSVYYCSEDWGDYDNDGDLDLLLTGYYQTDKKKYTIIYRNDSNGIFTDINAGLIGVQHGAALWFDYDNDGYLDALISGVSATGYVTNVYKNMGNGIFENIFSISGIGSSGAGCLDYDNDGKLDFIIGDKIYKNEGNDVFTQINSEFISGYIIDVGDYNNDGLNDILIASKYLTKIYKNNGDRTFTDINAGLTKAESGSVAWGDYDNDGKLDVQITGSGLNQIYKNEGNDSFQRIVSLRGVYDSSSSFFDYDNDCDLDILITGMTSLNSTSSRIAMLYRNNTLVSNSIPSSPSNLSTSYNDSTITFTWDNATDNETPQKGLSYNFYLGTQRLADDLNSAMSDTETGFRKIVQLGNAQQNTSYTLNKALPIGLYYWSVQAIDHAFAGSDFAPEKSFAVLSSPQNLQIKHKDDLLKLTWDEVPGAQMYYVYASDDPESEFVNISKQGTFNGVTWTQTISSAKKFYYVVAVIK